MRSTQTKRSPLACKRPHYARQMTSISSQPSCARQARGVHEGGKAVRAGHGLRGNLAPVVGYQRHVVHQAHGDARILPLAAEGYSHPAALGLDQVHEGGCLEPTTSSSSTALRQVCGCERITKRPIPPSHLMSSPLLTDRCFGLSPPLPPLPPAGALLRRIMRAHPGAARTSLRRCSGLFGGHGQGTPSPHRRLPHGARAARRR